MDRKFVFFFFPPNFPKDTTRNNIVIKSGEGDLGKYLASRKLYSFLTVLGKYLGTIWQKNLLTQCKSADKSSLSLFHVNKLCMRTYSYILVWGTDAPKIKQNELFYPLSL